MKEQQTIMKPEEINRIAIRTIIVVILLISFVTLVSNLEGEDENWNISIANKSVISAKDRIGKSMNLEGYENMMVFMTDMDCCDAFIEFPNRNIYLDRKSNMDDLAIEESLIHELTHARLRKPQKLMSWIVLIIAMLNIMYLVIRKSPLFACISASILVFIGWAGFGWGLREYNPILYSGDVMLGLNTIMYSGIGLILLVNYVYTRKW